ncbi:hypothetical protein CDL15_Pgr021421 [Punica granatum]|uniref:Uncharacterized protein n=1 Tax=Punica granatum TaxID=22663 RepID=A0A218WRS4_PUNGR|nr:hypothetical protein CDL15_Pgr021421 [Punica granatum]
MDGWMDGRMDWGRRRHHFHSPPIRFITDLFPIPNFPVSFSYPTRDKNRRRWCWGEFLRGQKEK